MQQWFPISVYIWALWLNEVFIYFTYDTLVLNQSILLIITMLYDPLSNSLRKSSYIPLTFIHSTNLYSGLKKECYRETELHLLARNSFTKTHRLTSTFHPRDPLICHAGVQVLVSGQLLDLDSGCQAGVTCFDQGKDTSTMQCPSYQFIHFQLYYQTLSYKPGFQMSSGDDMAEGAWCNFIQKV